MRLDDLRSIAAEQVPDVETLVSLLELTIEDVLARFPDYLIDNSHKFGVVDGDT